MSRLDQLSTRPPPESLNLAVFRHSQKHKASRAPIVNPYDKFTQPEFDAWIGDITTSIRRALGFEQEETRLFENIHVNGGLPEYPQLDLSDQDEVPDDSFAQIKTRRDKGKARDPREGPGLGRDRTQPIEVISSDEEEEGEVKALALSPRLDNSDVYDQDEDAESDYLWERSSSNNFFSSPRTRVGPPLRSRKKDEVEVSNAGSEEDDYEDDDGDFVNQTNDSSEVISISSDEDESVDEDDYHNRPGPSSSRYPRDDSNEEEEQGDDGDVDEIQLGDDTSLLPRHSPPHDKKYAENFHSGGELRLPAGAQFHPDHLGSLEVIEEDEELSLPGGVDHSDQTSSNLRSTSEFYQSYYSDGNVITAWDQQLDPRLFAHAEGVDNGFDSFLPLGVLTQNQSESHTHLDETEDAVDTTNGGAQSHSLPILPPVLPLKRNELIPQNAEIIAIDDSDDDGEDSLVVVPPLDAIVEIVTEPATVHPEELEVSEEPRTNFSTPYVPVVEHFDNVGEDALSVHTAHTEDIEHESRLQPLEVIEPETAEPNITQESSVMTLDLETPPLDVNDLELEEQDTPEIMGPEAPVLNAVDTLPLEAEPKSIVVVDELAPNYYDDFDDIYETPVPENLPPDSSDGGHLQPAGFVSLSSSQTKPHEDSDLSIDNIASQGIEVEGSQDTGLEACPAGTTGTKVNDSAEVSGLRRQSPWLEYNNVSKAVVPESAMETSRNGAITVDVHTPNGLRIASDCVSTSTSPKAEEPFPKTPGFTTEKTLSVLPSPSRTSTVPGQPQIPMPVMADANVPDPTESPTRLQEHPILSIPGTPDITDISLQTPQIAEEQVPALPTFPLGRLLHSLNPNADGLFTPADFSIPTTPAEDSGAAMLPSEWHETDVTSSRTVAPVDLQVQAELTEKPSPSLTQAVDDIFTGTDIISSGRKSVLMADPYPYCLSTPIISNSDDGLSEENDDGSLCSHSTTEKQNEMEDLQFAFPLAADLDPHIDSHINYQPATTEHEDTSALLTEFDLQTITTTQNLLEDMTVEAFGISPTLGDDTPVVIPFQTMEASSIPTTTAQQPLEAGADIQAFVQENAEANPETLVEEKKETKSNIPEDSPQASVVKKDASPQGAEASSRPSKRKRETSPDPDGSNGFSVNSKGKLRARSKGKKGGKEAETNVVEPFEHDTIYVRSRPPLKHRAWDSATSELSEISRSVDTGVARLIDKTSDSRTEVSRPHPHFHAPSLFHAHGRTKRQKTRIQPIASVKQTRDPPARHTPVVELPLHSASRDPSPPGDPILPTTAGTIIATEVGHASQSPGLPSADSSKLSLTTAVPAVESPTQEDATTSPLSSIATADELSQAIHSTPTTTMAPQPTPSLQSSPTRFLQASNSPSSIRSTRSQCKYHKITLPIGENGRYVYFMVPGCSLTNQELMKEEDIEDQGEATYEDSLRIIQNIDHLDFDPYLIGTLRQLVGLDILREGEVFYLPQPGDDVPRKHWSRQPNSEKTSTSFAGSPGYSGSARSSSTRPPVSNADSVFTSLSGFATDGSDIADNHSPSKGKKKTATWNGETKDITYDQVLPHEEAVQKTSRKSTKRGVKRTRTHDGATGNDGTRKSKRLRLHLTDSSLHQQQHD